MKGPGRFFLWIALLTAGLLFSITVAQIVTQKSLSRLRIGNMQATSAIMMNNRLQEMVNLAFELETAILTEKQPGRLAARSGIRDSLARLEYNIGILEKTWPDSSLSVTLQKLAGFVKSQIAISFSVIKAADEKDSRLHARLADTLRSNHSGDSIYTSAISFQKQLEQNLNRTTTRNSDVAIQLSFLNRLLAGVALLAILILATIIIRRQVKQLALIRDLEAARKAALQSAEAKDQFLANMSHEIRTPLNAIKGFGRILSQTPLTEEQQQYASLIAKASRNLLAIVNDILDFSKIEAGNLILQKLKFSLHEVIREVELMFKQQAAEKGLILTVTGLQNLPVAVQGDPERLRQILVNLIGNAIKFTTKGKVILSLKVEAAEQAVYKIGFSVTDSGPGIPAGKMQLIFERFEQLDYSYTRQQSGTGLGLAITKKLVEAMDGRLTVGSEVGKGSTFNVVLPFAKVKNEPGPETIAGAARLPGSITLQGVRVLVAEDNKMNQLLVKNILAKYAAEVEIEENGENALAAVVKKSYDIVLMDVQMPGMDGITATKKLREQAGSVIPVIAMTAHVLPGERTRCLEAGMNDFLSKPLDEDVLIEMITKYCKANGDDTDGKAPAEMAGGINISYLHMVCGNDREKIKRVLAELQKQIPAEIEMLRKSIIRPDDMELKRSCHHLRSTLSLFSEATAPMIILDELSRLLSRGSRHEKLKDAGGRLISELGKATKRLDELISFYN
ncbi:MAG: response regulator [Chitinophagaceae bacterium]|nr:response regulator [Chitinophagaceae bacterium]